MSNTDMRNKMELLERFLFLLEASRPSENPGVNFRGICKALGISPMAMEEILWEQCGLDSREIIEIYARK